MNPLKTFEIAFIGLSNGLHEFGFDLDADFFSCFEGSEVKVSELKGRLLMNKKSNMLDLDFYITGRVELECDRCLQPFWHNLDTHNVIYIRLGQKKEEQSDNLVIIPYTESHIDVSQYFFEFAILGLPVRRVHDGADEECDPSQLNQLQKYLQTNNNGSVTSATTDKPSDPRWDILKNLKFN